MPDLLANPSNVVAVVASAKPGDHVLLAAGTYRAPLSPTLVGTATAPIVIRAADAVNPPLLKGSVPVTGWQRHTGTIWSVSWATATQAVFAAGKALRQVGPMVHFTAKSSDGHAIYEQLGTGVIEDMVAGSFWFCDAANALYVRLPDDSDPNLVEIEVAQAQAVISLFGCEHVHVRDVAVCHSSSGTFQKGGGGLVLGTNCVAERVRAFDNDFSGISFAFGKTGARAVDCITFDNGCMGVSIDKHGDFLVRNCLIERNNTRRFAGTWIAAGIKITTDAWGTVEDCRVRHNTGVGIWADFCDSGGLLTVRRNTITDNSVNGIMFEVSQNCVAERNTIVRCGDRGVYVSASWDVRVEHNLVTGTKKLAAIDLSGVPRGGGKLVNVAVRNNAVVGNLGERDILVTKENGTDVSGVVVDANLYERDGAQPIMAHRGDSRTNWAGSTYRTLAEWRTATGFDKAEFQAL